MCPDLAAGRVNRDMQLAPRTPRFTMLGARFASAKEFQARGIQNDIHRSPPPATASWKSPLGCVPLLQGVLLNLETDIAAPNQTAVIIRPARDPVPGFRDMVATRRVELVRHSKPSKTEPNPYRLPLDGSMHQSHRAYLAVSCSGSARTSWSSPCVFDRTTGAGASLRVDRSRHRPGLTSPRQK